MYINYNEENFVSENFVLTQSNDDGHGGIISVKYALQTRAE